MRIGASVNQDLADKVDPCGARMARALSMRGFDVMVRLSAVGGM
jgi:hypothetical protein